MPGKPESQIRSASCYPDPARSRSFPDPNIRSMKSFFLATLVAVLSACFVSCAIPGRGDTRALNHTYQDARGLTFISLFDMGTEARGNVTHFGGGTSSKTLTLPRSDFERLWSQLDESKLTQFAVQDHDAKFNAQENYVIAKGMMPGGTTTYVIPKSNAPANVKAWVKAFRAKVGS